MKELARKAVGYSCMGQCRGRPGGNEVGCGLRMFSFEGVWDPAKGADFQPERRLAGAWRTAALHTGEKIEWRKACL